MNFKREVQSIASLQSCYKNGLQALGTNSEKIRAKDTKLCEGSVDLDNCIARQYPNEPRWDYIIGYSKYIYYVEVHPASFSDVYSVLKKLDWLKKWIRANTFPSEENRYRASFHWVSSGKVTFLKNSKYAGRLAERGLEVPTRILNLQ